MLASHLDRLERVKRLLNALPRAVAADSCPDVARLLLVLDGAYGNSDREARIRALQRDLKTLVDAGEIETVNPGKKPLRYRRKSLDPNEDPTAWTYALRQIQDLVADLLPQHALDRLWQRLLNDTNGPVLDESRLRIVPDTFRLKPVDLNPGVLKAIIEALAQHRALKIKYRNAKNERSQVIIHPQALIQRGPIPYLLALKNDETEPVRLYALHRMIRADVLPDSPAHAAAGFSLENAIDTGLVDFGHGEMIDLEIRVRGYLAPVLYVCKLAHDQHLEDEPPDSEFEIRVRARVPSTGQLLRWLLGAGTNIEVIAPLGLRGVIAEQARKTAEIYKKHPIIATAAGAVSRKEAGEGNPE